MFQTTNQHGLTLISQEYMANQEHVESLFFRILSSFCSHRYVRTTMAVHHFPNGFSPWLFQIYSHIQLSATPLFWIAQNHPLMGIPHHD
jgi:hypothetical protein